MRRKWLLGFGFALAGGVALGPVAAQPPASPFGTLKTAPTAPTAPPAPGAPPVGGFQPAAPAAPPAAGLPAMPAGPVADVEIPSVLGKDHPWLIKPEHGPYFILVKSYVRPARGSRSAELDKGLTARELAETLAKEIREKHQVQAFLFEYVSEERKAEERARQEARRKAQAYQAQIEELRKRAALQGLDFMEPDNKIRVLAHDYKDQIGVLVGGFQTEDAAVKALPLVKAWPIPKNEVLCDKASIVKPGPDGKPTIGHAPVNPYAGAFVVPNPAVPRAREGYRGLDPFVVKLNEGRPYNLLKAQKGWTLGVKSFTAPVEMVSGDAPSVKKPGTSRGGDVLAAGAADAEKMAEALRALALPGGQKLEAFVLHTRSASLVTVGQFDGPNDPELLALQRTLAALQVKVTEDKMGTRPVANAPALFERTMPMPIPRPAP